MYLSEASQGIPRPLGISWDHFHTGFRKLYRNSKYQNWDQSHHTMTGGASYLWRTIIDEENMIKRSSLIGGVVQPYFCHWCQRGRECWRARILPSMTKGKIVSQSCHWCQYGICWDVNILEMPGSKWWCHNSCLGWLGYHQWRCQVTKKSNH